MLFLLHSFSKCMTQKTPFRMASSLEKSHEVAGLDLLGLVSTLVVTRPLFYGDFPIQLDELFVYPLLLTTPMYFKQSQDQFLKLATSAAMTEVSK